MTLVNEQISTNVILEIMVLAFMMVNTIAWLLPGVMKYQLNQVFETRSERTFALVHSKYYTLRALLLIEFFLFVGLHLFLLVSGNSAEQLAHPEESTWILLAKCASMPLLWFVLQQVLYLWWANIFHERGKSLILNRIFVALHILAAPIVMIVFLFEMVELINLSVATILLSLTFILMQIVFIFSGIKIFLSNWSTLCFLFLYLCTLEIAPLVMMYQILTR